MRLRFFSGILIGLLMIPACQGKGTVPVTPDAAGPGITESPLLGASRESDGSDRGIVVEPADAPLIIEAQKHHAGEAVLMAGAGQGDPTMPPLTIHMSGSRADASLLAISASGLGGETPNPGGDAVIGVRLRSAVGSYSVAAYSTMVLPRNGELRYFKNVLQPHSYASLEFFNATEPGEAPATEAVRLQWDWTRAPVGSVSDAAEGPSWNPPVRPDEWGDGFLFHGIPPYPRNRVDRCQYSLREGIAYRFDLSNSNGFGDDWSLSVQITPGYNITTPEVELIPSSTMQTVSGEFTPPVSGWYQFEVRGRPLMIEGEGFRPFQYRYRLAEQTPGATEPPIITNFPEDGSLWGKCGERLTLEPLLQGVSPKQMKLTLPASFSLNATRTYNTSNKSLMYALPPAGSYTGTIELSDGFRWYAPVHFTFTVEAGFPWVDTGGTKTLPAYDNPIALDFPIIGSPDRFRWMAVNQRGVKLWQSEEAVPTFEWSTTGPLTLWLRLHNELGYRDYKLPVTITAPPDRPQITAVISESSVLTGDEPSTLQVQTDVPVDAYEWVLLPANGNRFSTDEVMSSEPTPVVIPKAGRLQGTVRVHNAAGWSVRSDIDVLIAGAGPFQWSAAPSSLGATGPLVLQDLAVHNNRLLVIAKDGHADRHLRFFRSSPMGGPGSAPLTWESSFLPPATELTKLKSAQLFIEGDQCLVYLSTLSSFGFGNQPRVYLLRGDLSASTGPITWHGEWLPYFNQPESLEQIVSIGQRQLIVGETIQCTSLPLVEVVSTSALAPAIFRNRLAVLPGITAGSTRQQTAPLVIDDHLVLALVTSQRKGYLASVAIDDDWLTNPWQTSELPGDSLAYVSFYPALEDDAQHEWNLFLNMSGDDVIHRYRASFDGVERVTPWQDAGLVPDWLEMPAFAIGGNTWVSVRYGTLTGMSFDTTTQEYMPWAQWLPGTENYIANFIITERADEERLIALRLAAPYSSSMISTPIEVLIATPGD